MARISVYNPKGIPGTIEQGDRLGSTFTPDVESPFQQVSKVVASTGLSPIVNMASRGSALIPSSFLQPLGTASGIGIGILTPVPGGATGTGALGGGLGRFLQEFNQAKRQGATSLPPSSEADIFGAAGQGAGIGATVDLGKTGVELAGKVASKVAPMVGGIRTLFSEPRQVALAQKARGIFEQVKSGSGPAFEASMNRLRGAVNIQPEVAMLHQMSLGNETAQAALADATSHAARVGDTTLQRFLANPDLAQVATPLEAHQVASTLKQTTSSLSRLRLNPNIYQSGASTLLKMGEFDSTLQKFSSDIMEKITQLHPEEYPAIVQQYGKTQQAARLLTPEFAPTRNRLIQNIKGGFGGGEVAEAVKQTLPERASNELFGVANAQKFLNRINPGTYVKRFLGR